MVVEIISEVIIYCRRNNCLENQKIKKERSKVSQCLKITEKVSFNIASERSYVYILSEQSSSKMVNLASI